MQTPDGETLPAADEVLIYLGRNTAGDILLDVTVRLDNGDEVKGSRLVPAAEIMEPGRSMKPSLTVDIT
jgi:hypothetical protein